MDLSGSYDNDGPKEGLNYLVTKFGPKEWQNSSSVPISFVETEFDTYNYHQIRIRVRDIWGMENKVVQVVDEKEGTQKEVENLTIIIEFLPEDEPYALPWTEFFSIKLHQTIIHLLFLIILIVFDIAAVVMIVNKRNKINKRRRAREMALDTARQKQMEEDKKKKEDIYSHIQYVEEEGAAGQVAVAGASAISGASEQEFGFTQESVEDLMAPAEPEAPQLVSVAADQPVYESDTERLEAEAAMEMDSNMPPEVSLAPAPKPMPTPAQPVKPVQAVAAQPASASASAPTQIQPVPARPVQAQPVQAKPVIKPTEN